MDWVLGGIDWDVPVTTDCGQHGSVWRKMTEDPAETSKYTDLIRFLVRLTDELNEWTDTDLTAVRPALQGR